MRSREAEVLEQLTPRLRRELRRHWLTLQEQPGWCDTLPVLLLERCWLRLSCVPVAELANRLPPDSSRDAPELSRYRELRSGGLDGWQAQQICWEEFGAEACRQAQRRFWTAQERGNHGWTLQRYLDLLADYRRRGAIERPRSLPLLVLARGGPEGRHESHLLLWLCPGADEAEPSMRHTCP